MSTMWRRSLKWAERRCRIVNYPTLKGLGVPLHRHSIEKSLTGVNSRSSYGTD